MIDIIGNRRIVKKLGQGGMGVVYLAEHMHLDKLFAIKSLRKELTSNPQFSQSFFQEANNQGRLDHPNIVQVTDYEEQHGQFFLVMEYVDGEDLDQLIRRKGKLTVKEALPIMKDILAGLGYAHRNAMIHRDIKPSNIMVDKEGRARVTDFGLSVLMSDENRSSKVGTPEYQSPEQIDPNCLAPGGILDHRTDIYSLGIVFYEMLTGTIPFEGDRETVYQKQLQSSIPEPRKINKNIPKELSRIIKRCVAKDPDERFQGCDELLKAVIAYEKRKIRQRIIFLVSTLILITSIASFLVTQWSKDKKVKEAVRQKQEAVVKAERIQIESAKKTISGNIEIFERLCSNIKKESLLERRLSLYADVYREDKETHKAQLGELSRTKNQLKEDINHINEIHISWNVDDQLLENQIKIEKEQATDASRLNAINAFNLFISSNRKTISTEEFDRVYCK